MPGADEQAAGAPHLPVAAQCEVGRAAADVEVHDGQPRLGARQTRTASHERQPRFQARVVRAGDEGVAQAPADQADQCRGVFALGRQAGQQRPAPENVFRPHVSGRQPSVEVLLRPSLLEPIFRAQGCEDQFGAIALADLIQLHTACNRAACQPGRGDDGAAGRGAEIQAD
jgi:hypothetical protein